MTPKLERFAPLFTVAMFCGAAWLLWHELERYHWQDIRRSLHGMPPLKVGLCLALTVLNYSILVGYDLLAVRAISHPLPLRRIAFASFTGFVASYNFGATVGGVPVRYRVYSAYGLSAVEIVRLTIMIGVTFWIGQFSLAGLAFVIDPFPIPDKLHFPFKTVYGLGWVLIAVAIGYVLLTALWRKPLTVQGKAIHLPGPGLTIAQISVAVMDLLVAAASLYVLLPTEIGLSYPQFLGIYLLAVVAVIVTNVPGGVGVFELVILTLTASTTKGGVVAALLIYRVIYYLLPLFLAGLLLGWQEYRLHRQRIEPLMCQAGRMASAIAPTLLSGAALIGGGVLLLSGSAPGIEARIRSLKAVVPLPFVEVSHFVGSLAGAALLLVARGLQQRLDSAWWTAVGLLAVGIVTSLLKGFDYEEAILLALVLLILVLCRNRFYRKGSLLHQRFTAGWIGAILIVVICSVWIGMFAHKHIDYRNELWWQFAFYGDASRFLRAAVGVVGLLLIFAVWKLLTPAEGPEPDLSTKEDLEEAAQIVAQSPRTSANLALLGDKRFLFSEDHSAFLMYAVEDRSWVTMGDPVGPPEQWSDLVWKFRELCDRYDGWPVFYQVEAAHLPVYLDQGLTLLKLGEEARVPVQEFTLEGSHHKSLRSGRNKLQKAGCTFEIVPREQVPTILPRLKHISDAWMAEKHAAEKGFSLGFYNEDYLRRYSCAVVKQQETIVAFANLWLGAGQEEFSLDLMRYGPAGPHGLMDYLFTELLLWGRQAGYQWFNLGMAPLSGIKDRPLAPLWNKAVGLIYRHGDHFYGFEGLREYKDKFDPVWQAKYLASPGGLALPKMLADVASLISRSRPKASSIPSSSQEHTS